MSDTREQFRDAMRAAGLSPPDTIEPGRFHRFPGDGKRNGNTAGWCKLFDDERGGIYGDYSTGLSETWQAERSHSPTPAEREAFRRKVEEAKARAEAKRKAESAEAARIASERWQGAPSARKDHPYLARKGVQTHGTKQDGDELLVPMRDTSGELRSLQTIAPDGVKRFLYGRQVHGYYFSIGKPDGVLCIAEGFATGVSIREATGHAVAVAFNAGNLEPVAVALRAKMPDVRIIVCADDDFRTADNPGIRKATNAARAVGGLLAIPHFGDDWPDGATDFNDLARHRGADAVKRCIANAAPPDVATEQANTQNAPAADPDGLAWPEPLPLVAKIPSEAYPLDALPPAIQAAVEEVQAFTKAPVVLVASSALAALSLAAQAHVDVTRADKLAGPVGLYLLTIADSGERKSTCDSFFARAIRDYEAKQAIAVAPELQAHKANFDAWEAKRSAILEAIRKEAKQGDTTAREGELRDLEQKKPKTPRVPRLVYGDATPEALTWNLAKSWPSAGVLSSEAGAIFGAHGMGRDSLMRYLATLNELWDGKPQHFDRRTSESYTVSGARLTVALQIQEATLRSFFDRSGGLARGSGFLARFLIAWPESTMGSRPFDDPPKNWPALASFHRRIAEILEIAATIDDAGTLSPGALALKPDAKAAWITFHDAIEGELRSGGELFDVRDVASKAADNAARMAALFHVFAHGTGGAVGPESFNGASRIVAWHLNEARRFFGELALPAELANAVRLDTWLAGYCRDKGAAGVATRTIQQFGPGGLRERAAIEAAARQLEDLGRARLLQDGRRKEIRINPALLSRGAE